MVQPEDGESTGKDEKSLPQDGEITTRMGNHLTPDSVGQKVEAVQDCLL